MFLLQFAQSSTDYSFDPNFDPTTAANPGPFPWGTFLPILFVSLALAVVVIVGMWKVFQKAGKPGWAAIVPIYNGWVLFEITGFPGWLALLSLVPVANIVAVVVTLAAYFKLAKAFGKGTGFAVASIFFPYVTMPILGFGKATYQAPAPAFAAAQPAAGAYPGQPAANPYAQPGTNQFAQPVATPVAPAQPAPQNPNPPVGQQPPQDQPPVPPAAPQQ